MCWNRDLKTHSKLFLFLHFQRKWKTELFFKCFRISIFLTKILVLNHECFFDFSTTILFFVISLLVSKSLIFLQFKVHFSLSLKGLSPKWKLLIYWSAFFPIFRSVSSSSSPRNRENATEMALSDWSTLFGRGLGWGWVRDGEARALDRLFESENVVANQFFSR